MKTRSTATHLAWMGNAAGRDMEDGAGHRNDESVHASGGNAIKISLVGFDKPLLTALSIVLSIVAMIFGYMALHQSTVDEYWLARSEGFLEQLADQGVHVPADLLPHKERKK